MAETKKSGLTPFQKQALEVTKKINEYKLGAEANIVALIYKYPDLYTEMSLTIQDFSNNCWKVYLAIAEGVLVQENKSLTDINVGLYLEKHPKLQKKYDEYGGYEMIEKAASYVDKDSFEGYVCDLKKWNCIFAMNAAGFPVGERLSDYADMSVEDIYEEHEGMLNHVFANSDTKITSYDVLDKDLLYEYIEELDSGANIGMPIEADLLNKEIGGLQNGHIYAFMAGTGAGKSTITINYIMPAVLKYNRKMVMFINEESHKKVMKEMLLWVAANVLKKPIQKMILRDGFFGDEVKATLKEAADWLAEQNKCHNITVIPLEHYNVEIVLKLIKKYKNLFGVDLFLLDTFKASTDATEEDWKALKHDSEMLYNLIKEEVLNVCLVVTMQLSKSALRNRHLTNADVGQSRSVVDVFSVNVLFRRVERDECENGRRQLDCFRLEGKTKIPFGLNEDKYYLLFFIGKNRFGSADQFAIVTEANLSTNEYKDIGYTIVPEDWI